MNQTNTEPDLYPVPADMVRVVWPKVEPVIKKAINLHPGYETSDVKEAIERKEMQLWIAAEGNKVIAACVTRIVIYPRMKELEVTWVAGKGADDWLHFRGEIEKWAATIGCERIVAYGRRGWERKLRGEYEPKMTVYVKVL